MNTQRFPNQQASYTILFLRGCHLRIQGGALLILQFIALRNFFFSVFLTSFTWNFHLYFPPFVLSVKQWQYSLFFRIRVRVGRKSIYSAQIKELLTSLIYVLLYYTSMPFRKAPEVFTVLLCGTWFVPTILLLVLILPST